MRRGGDLAPRRIHDHRHRMKQHHVFRSVLALLSGLAFHGIAAMPADAQHVQVVPGRVMERVRSSSDTTQHWALFVPSQYDASTPVPILFLMDPRGRAMIPLDRARGAAERFGWAIISSYNTMSDGPLDPNVRAMSAMLEDAQSLLQLDTRRFYLAGFSGTARVAWAITPRLDSAVAGILGAGAGTPVRAEWLAGPDAPRVAFFGTAGTTDFNYNEVMDLERWLRTGNHTYALRAFEGSHEWPPESIFSDAIAWFEIQAMRSGRRKPDAAIADSLFTTWHARADSLARTGTDPEILYGLDLFEEIARSFDGLHDIHPARSAADSLKVQANVRSAIERRNQLARHNADFNTRFFRVMADVRKAEEPMEPDRVVRDLRIDEIIRERDEAVRRADRLTADAAQRKLESIFVNTSFYTAQTFLDSHRPDHALAILHVAHRIHPDHPRVLHNRARAHVLLGNFDQALSDLAAAIRAGFPPTAIRDDPAFAPLRGMATFDALFR